MRSLWIPLALFAVAACDKGQPSKDAQLSLASAPPATVTAEAAVPPTPEPGAEAVAQSAQPGAIYTPATGSQERTILLDGLRALVRDDLGGDVVFVVKTLRSSGEWAFAELEPQWRDGRRIDAAQTPLYRREPDWPFDGLHTEAIWHKVDGQWTIVAHMIGSTDVWWVDYCNRVPRGILTGC